MFQTIELERRRLGLNQNTHMQEFDPPRNDILKVRLGQPFQPSIKRSNLHVRIDAWDAGVGDLRWQRLEPSVWIPFKSIRAPYSLISVCGAEAEHDERSCGYGEFR